MRALVCALIFLGGAASAQDVRATPEWAASLQVIGLLNRSLTVELERLVPEAKLSFQLSAGFRLPVGGDYSGTEWSAGLEARRFLWSPHGLPGGAFVLGRVDGGVQSLRLGERALPASARYGFALGAGYRFVPAWRISLTPTVALGLSGHSPTVSLAAPHWALRAQFGLSAGVLF